MDNQQLQLFNDAVKLFGDDVFVKPLCDFFQIDYDNQMKRINSDEILKLSTGKNTDKLLFGDERERVTLTKSGFVRWIQLINPQIVQVSLREKLKLFQQFIFQYFWGNVEKERRIAVTYQRRDKLKKIKAKIITEINNCDKEIDQYLADKSTQLSLSFSNNKRIRQ